MQTIRYLCAALIVSIGLIIPAQSALAEPPIMIVDSLVPTLTVWAIADIEHQQLFGEASLSVIEEAISQTSAILERDVGVRIQLAGYIPLTESTVLDSTDTEMLLNQIGAYASEKNLLFTEDVVILFTPRSFGNTIISNAYFGSACVDSYGVGHTRLDPLGSDMLLQGLGHMIGVLLGADTSDTGLMKSFLNGSAADNFYAPESAQQIQSWIVDNGSCLSNLNKIPVAFSIDTKVLKPGQQSLNFEFQSTNSLSDYRIELWAASKGTELEDPAALGQNARLVLELDGALLSGGDWLRYKVRLPTLKRGGLFFQIFVIRKETGERFATYNLVRKVSFPKGGSYSKPALLDLLEKRLFKAQPI